MLAQMPPSRPVQATLSPSCLPGRLDRSITWKDGSPEKDMDRCKATTTAATDPRSRQEIEAHQWFRLPCGEIEAIMQDPDELSHAAGPKKACQSFCRIPIMGRRR